MHIRYAVLSVMVYLTAFPIHAHGPKKPIPMAMAVKPRVNNWAGPFYQGTGFIDSQHGGKKAWIGKLTSYTDTDHGNMGFGTKGHASSYGTWDTRYEWLGTGAAHPASIIIDVTGIATANGTRITGSTFGGGEHMIGCLPYNINGHWWYIAMFNASAIANQSSNYWAWRGVATCGVGNAYVIWNGVTTTGTTSTPPKDPTL